MSGKIVICENARATVLKYIQDHFDQIVPFRLDQDVTFQMRFSPKEHESLTEDELRSLREHESVKLPGRTATESYGRWQKDRFWESTKDYLYEFALKRSYCLQTNDEIDSYSTQRITFIDQNECPPFILLNIEKHNKDIPLKREG